MIDKIDFLDRTIFLYLNSFHHTFLNPIMLTLSGQLIWIPFIVFFLFHSYKSDGKKGAFFFLLFLSLVLSASDATSSYIIKNYFNRLRPCKETELIALIHSFGQKCGGRFGFVSSHASNSFALVFFSVRAIKFKNHLKYYMWIMPTIVAYSRIYLGVHYPGDIIGGIVVGIFWGFIFSQLLKLSYYGANR